MAADDGSGLLKASIISSSLFFGLTLVYLSLYLVILMPLPGRQASAFGAVALAVLFQALPLIVFGLVLNRVYVVARYHKTQRPLLTVAREVWRVASDRKRLFLGIPVLCIMILFKWIYMEFKVNIPLLKPFALDQTFYEWDKALHLGVDPWRLVDPFFELSDYLVVALNVNYSFWFMFMWIAFASFAFSRTLSVERTRFLLAFFLVWAIGGSLMAVQLSSAGPAFYSDLGMRPDPYSPLMEKLKDLNLAMHISAIDLQRMLWEGYAENGHNYGISAMPSMHNAIAFLLVLSFWSPNRAASMVLLGHAFLVYIGSFYLGWHYAVDAYVGWAVAILVWWFVKPIAVWWHGIPAIKKAEAALEAG